MKEEVAHGSLRDACLPRDTEPKKRISCIGAIYREEMFYLQTPLMLHYVHAIVQFTVCYTVVSSLVISSCGSNSETGAFRVNGDLGRVSAANLSANYSIRQAIADLTCNEPVQRPSTELRVVSPVA